MRARKSKTHTTACSVLSPGQTIATCQRNISQYCWAQHVARVWPPCCAVLTTPNMSQQGGQTHATSCAQHVVICWKTSSRSINTQKIKLKNDALRIYESLNVHPLTTNLYFSPNAQRYSSKSVQKIRSPPPSRGLILEFNLFCERKLIYELIYAKNVR